MTSQATPYRGEVWWFEEPETGRRPGLVLTRDSAIPVLRWVLVAPITRTVRGIPTELRLDESDGMPQVCAASLDNVRPVRRSLLVERLTRLSARRVDEACLALRLAVDC